MKTGFIIKHAVKVFCLMFAVSVMPLFSLTQSSKAAPPPPPPPNKPVQLLRGLRPPAALSRLWQCTGPVLRHPGKGHRSAPPARPGRPWSGKRACNDKGPRRRKNSHHSGRSRSALRRKRPAQNRQDGQRNNDHPRPWRHAPGGDGTPGRQQCSPEPDCKHRLESRLCGAHVSTWRA